MEGKKRDTAMEWAFIGVGTIAVVIFIAWMFGPQITKGWWWWQGLKANVIAVIWRTDTMQALAAFAWTEHIWRGVKMTDSWDVAQNVGSYWRWPLCIGLGYWSWTISRKNPLENLKNVYSSKTLMKSQTSIWPHMRPIEKLDIINEDIEKGLWKAGYTTLEFVEKNDLLNDGTAEVNKEKATRVFAKQLSDVWAGVDKMPRLHKAFFTIFAAQGNWDGRKEAPKKYQQAKDKARDGINKLASSFFINPKKLDYSWVDSLLAENIDHPEVIKIIDSHAYVHTVMMSMLEYARLNGVLASSEFFWLRSVDRKLWYTLNNVGRNVAWPEVAGIYGHWLGEKISESKQIRPYVLKATQALAEAMKSVKVKPKKAEIISQESVLSSAAKKLQKSN
jgi:intracellular multiplication protein IcmP